VALAEASGRWKRWGAVSFWVVIAFLCVTNLVLTNQYLASLIRYGPTITWSDAIYPLSTSLAKETREVIVMDWDIYDPLLLLHRVGGNIRAGYFENTAGALGFRKELLRAVADGHGRAVFEVYQFVKP
jgi:hypothetical protein